MFPNILTDWVELIPSTDKDINNVAQQEGWILNPDSKNISEPLGLYKEEN